MIRAEYESGGQLPESLQRSIYIATDIDPLAIEAELMRHGHAEQWLGQADSCRPTYADSKRLMFTRANAFLGSMGVDLTHWPEQLDNKTIPDEYGEDERLSCEEARMALAEGVMPAEIVFERAYWGLPVESDEEGNSTSELIFSLLGRSVGLIADGEFWSGGSVVHYMIKMEGRVHLLNSGCVPREEVANDLG
jgi:hypothetical protein